MERNTSISLGDHFKSFVDDRVSAGKFKNASEVIKAGLRLLEEEESRIIALQEAIDQGFKSGIDENFDARNHLTKLKATKRTNG